MAASILSILAALLPVLLDWLEGRREGKPYEDKQKIRRAAYSGDVDTLSAELALHASHVCLL